MGKQTARAVIFNAQGQLLLVERHKGSEHYFALPGGHIDPGEEPEQAVVREVREETGLEVTLEKLLYTSSDDLYQNDQRIFLCKYLGGDPVLQPDSIEAELMGRGEPQEWNPGWFSFDDLREQTIFPKGLLKYLEEDQAKGYHHNPYKIVERRV
jgi:mutator protein MutT